METIRNVEINQLSFRTGCETEIQLSFGGLEELHNQDFNRVQFEAVRSEAGLNRFVMTPTKWIEQTNAIGIVSKAGRYGGGTYVQSALNWMEKTDGIECSLGKCFMIIGEICRQKAMATP